MEFILLIFLFIPFIFFLIKMSQCRIPTWSVYEQKYTTISWGDTFLKAFISGFIALIVEIGVLMVLSVFGFTIWKGCESHNNSSKPAAPAPAPTSTTAYNSYQVMLGSYYTEFDHAPEKEKTTKGTSKATIDHSQSMAVVNDNTAYGAGVADYHLFPGYVWNHQLGLDGMREGALSSLKKPIILSDKKTIFHGMSGRRIVAKDTSVNLYVDALFFAESNMPRVYHLVSVANSRETATNRLEKLIAKFTHK